MFTITTSTETKGSAEVETIDIAIVGGGMVGLSLALLLALKNVVLADSGGANAAPKEPWRIRVIERFAAAADVGEIDAAAYQSSFDARSTALARSSEDILRAAGIWPLLSRHLTPDCDRSCLRPRPFRRCTITRSRTQPRGTWLCG